MAEFAFSEKEHGWIQCPKLAEVLGVPFTQLVND
jgi:hypothetical protein